MKILHEKYAKITTGEFQGKIFRLKHYHQHLQVAYFPGLPQQLISIADLELVNMPFPYWRTEGDGMMRWRYQPSSTRCDTLPIGEQTSLSTSRLLRLKTQIKFHTNRLKKNFSMTCRSKLQDDDLYCFLEIEIVLESNLIQLLKNIIPVTAPDKNILLKLEREYITKNPPIMAGGNIATSREEIWQTTQPQEKLIFPPSTKLKKKPGRRRGATNKIPASGWLDIREAKDGSMTIHYCYHVCKWVIDRIKISTGQLPVVEYLIKEKYPIEQIKSYLSGVRKNAVR